jgi:hypothetical protein
MHSLQTLKGALNFLEELGNGEANNAIFPKHFLEKASQAGVGFWQHFELVLQ